VAADSLRIEELVAGVLAHAYLNWREWLRLWLRWPPCFEAAADVADAVVDDVTDAAAVDVGVEAAASVEDERASADAPDPPGHIVRTRLASSSQTMVRVSSGRLYAASQ